MVIPVWDEQAYFDGVRRILREIVKIRTDTGYSTDQVLHAMIVEALLGLRADDK